MNAQPCAAAATHLRPLVAPACQDNFAVLTRVSLAYIAQRINIYLRFGKPVRIIRLDRSRHVAVFLPGAVFCRIRWQANDCGSVRWQLMVMQACTTLDGVQRISGVLPGARLLLHADGEAAVRAVLSQIDAIEGQGIAPTAVSPAYWRALDNRLAAHLPLPAAYTSERHATWQTGRALS